MWHKSLLDTINHAKNRGLVLYGAGFWGKIAYEIFTKMGSIPLCFCDDNISKQNTNHCGLPVYSLEYAIQKYPNAIYLVCTDGRKVSTRNPLAYQNMIQKLMDSHVYDSHSELRIPLYAFLLDLKPSTLMDSHSSASLPADAILADDIHNLIIFNHMGWSGSWYLEELLDGHPNILTLPYATHVLITVYQKRLQYLKDDELLIEMAAQMTNYFQSSVMDPSGNGMAGVFCMASDQDGNFIPDVLINPNDFMVYLQCQFKGRPVCLDSLGHMMKLYASVYSNCLGKKKTASDLQTGYWFFYHMHQVDWNAKDTFQYFNKNDFRRIENLFIIREPIQQLFSCLRSSTLNGHNNLWEKDESFFSKVIHSECGVFLEKQPGVNNVRAIRFEDLKLHPRKTLESLCAWLNIPYHDCLSTTTVNGFQVYTTTVSANGNTVQITGNDTTAINRKNFSELLTAWDEARHSETTPNKRSIQIHPNMPRTRPRTRRY